MGAPSVGCPSAARPKELANSASCRNDSLTSSGPAFFAITGRCSLPSGVRRAPFTRAAYAITIAGCSLPSPDNPSTSRSLPSETDVRRSALASSFTAMIAARCFTDAGAGP